MKIHTMNAYVAVIQAQLDLHKLERGYRARMAKAGNIHATYLSRVLKGEVHLTPDQGFLLSQFWGFDPEEQDYFMSLVGKERASSRELRKHYDGRLEAYKRKKNHPSAISDEEGIRTLKDLPILHWEHMAVRTALRLPGCNTETAIAKRLGITERAAAKTLAELEKFNMVARDGKIWLHQGHDVSAHDIPNIDPASMGVRMKSALGIYCSAETDVRQTTLLAVSEADFLRLKEKVVDFMREFVRETRNSKPETIACMLLDWFRF